MVEIQAMGGSQAVLDELEQMLQTSGKGTLTPANAKYLSQFVDRVAGGASDSLEKMNQDWSDKVTKRTKYDKATAYEKMTGKLFSPTVDALPTSSSMNDNDKKALAWAQLPENAHNPNAQAWLKAHGMK